MSSIIHYFKNSRVSSLDMTDCVIQLNCNLRQFALYFEMEDENVARSLWNDIHDDNILSYSLTSLKLAGVKMFINQRRLCLFQELSMLQCDKLQLLDLSLCKSEDRAVSSLTKILSSLSNSLMGSLETLLLNNYCLEQMVPLSALQDMREVLIKFDRLKSLSLAGSWFMANEGKEDILKLCAEMLPSLDTLNLSNCYISRETGSRLSRAVKARVKGGTVIKIHVGGCSGEGVNKLVSIIDQSKHVYTCMDHQTSILTIQGM